MEKGAQSYLGLVFGPAHRSAQARNKSAWVRYKLAWAGPQVVQPGFYKPLPGNVRESYVSHLPLSYGIGTRAF